MATAEQVANILSKMEGSHPGDFFNKIDATQVGIGSVLRLLERTEGTVTAGKISETLSISTARVAVLLKKMVSKGLITKEQNAADRRVTEVKLTKKGREHIADMNNEVYCRVAHVLDTVGEERLLEFITTANEIRDAYVKYLSDFKAKQD